MLVNAQSLGQRTCLHKRVLVWEGAGVEVALEILGKRSDKSVNTAAEFNPALKNELLRSLINCELYSLRCVVMRVGRGLAFPLETYAGRMP